MHSVKRDLLYLKIFKHKNRKRNIVFIYNKDMLLQPTTGGSIERAFKNCVCCSVFIGRVCMCVCLSVSVCAIAFIDLCGVSLSIKSFASSVQITN